MLGLSWKQIAGVAIVSLVTSAIASRIMAPKAS